MLLLRRLVSKDQANLKAFVTKLISAHLIMLYLSGGPRAGQGPKRISVGVCVCVCVCLFVLRVCVYVYVCDHQLNGCHLLPLQMKSRGHP